MSLCEDEVILFGNSLIFIALKVEEWEEDERLYCVTSSHKNLFGLSYSTSIVLIVLLFSYGLFRHQLSEVYIN